MRKGFPIGMVVCLAWMGLASLGAKTPNILWLSCEDISPHLGCYGDSHAITPNLDRLAGRGIRYTHAFTASGVCAPCRSGIITGLYHTTLGTHHMRCRARMPAEVKPFPVYLREKGFFCTNQSKTDYQFQHPRETWDVSGARAHWKNRSEGAPFFSVFNFGGCHESGIASKEKYEKVTENLKPGQRQEAASLDLPPYYPDTPAVREDWKRNYELITALDEWVGEHLRALEEAGLADTTIVMFWSDHGVGLPRAKRWLYDSGTHVPLIVYVPPAFQDLRAHTPAGECQDLISSIDFGPTVLSLAGLPVPKVMQGRPFLGKQPGAKRKYVFGARDRMDERYDIIRSVRDRRYRYIRNYEPLKPYYQYMNTPEKGMTMQEIRRVGRDGRLPAGALAFMGEGKPVEELYDLEKDPHEIRNLATDPDHRERLERMRQVQQDWSRRTRDLGLVPESQIAAAEGVAGSRFALLREGSSEDLLQRLVRVAARASEGPEALGDLRRASGDTSPAVRYWAATGMGHYPDDLGAGDHQLLLFLVEDDDPAVRVAAARALASIDAFHTRALTLLEKELSSEEEWVRLQAAIVLDEMGERARPSLTALQRCLKGQPNKYITRVANHAVNALLGTNHRVR